MDLLSMTIPLQYDTPLSPFLAGEFDEALEWIKKNDFDAIELCIVDPAKVVVEELNTKLAMHNLKVAAISTDQANMLEGISLTDGVKEKRDKATLKIMEYIDLATRIGYPLVAVGTIRGSAADENIGKALDILKAELKICLQYAKDRGVALALEPINRYETGLINSCWEALDFCNRLGAYDNLGILYNTFHSNIEDREMIQAIKALKGKVMHVHFADSNRRLPLEGHINFKKVVRALRKIGYQGHVSLETLSLPDRDSVKQQARKSLNCLQKLKEPIYLWSTYYID